jgi:phage tail-like protein
MPDLSANNFFFLNRDGRWPNFQWSGLEVRKDGSLQLCSVPLLTTTLPDAVKNASTPDGPAGIAIDGTGTVYFTDPDGNCVRRILGCDGKIVPVPCMGGSGGGPTNLNLPRGLLISPLRPSLFVADSGNHRILVFDLETCQLMEIWGKSSSGGVPQAGSAPGQFNTPWNLRMDSSGNVYVVDYGNQRIQKFNALGDVVPAFWNSVQASGLLHQPADIAVWQQNSTTWIFVVDASTATIFVFDGNGEPVLDSQGYPRSLSDSHLTQPMGISAEGGSLYVGDNAARTVFRFQIADTFSYVGAAIGYQGPVAALRLDGKQNLWVHPGGALAPVKLEAQQGYGTSGSLWLRCTAPVEANGRKVVWHRLQALAKLWSSNSASNSSAHLEVFAFAANGLAQAPVVDPAADNPFADPKWQSVAYVPNLDLTDLYIGGCKAKYLWVGAQFSGDGSASPVLRQLRVEFDYPTYDVYLPAVYRNQSDCNQFLLRLLSLLESLFGGVESEIRSIPKLFDPQAAPRKFLAWLAGCMGLDLDDNWDEQQQREIIAQIFSLSGWRGTAKGLRESLRLFAGVDAIVEEPILNASWWSLPGAADTCCDACASSSTSAQDSQNSILGWTTMLAPAQPQGAVVGTSTVLDESHLIADEDFGSPLFSDVAYQFCVELYRSQVMCPEAMTRVRTIIEQEKPAHTACHLCVIDPKFRVGFQSRVGIDSVVAGPPRSLALGTGQALGVDSALAGAAPSLLGADSCLGVTTRLA